MTEERTRMTQREFKEERKATRRALIEAGLRIQSALTRLDSLYAGALAEEPPTFTLDGFLADERQRVKVNPFGTGRCSYCLRYTSDLTADHIVPFSKGGSDAPDNLVPACQSCNSRKHDTSLLGFITRAVS